MLANIIYMEVKCCRVSSFKVETEYFNSLLNIQTS